DEFRAWRLERALAGRAPRSETAGRPSTSPMRDGVLCSAPPLARRSMVSEPMDPRFLRGFFSRRRAPAAAPADHALYGRPLRQSPGEPAAALDPGLRTAIVMPICAEPVDRVFAGLRAIHRSLERAGALHLFHFFVLSDTAEAGAAVKEEEAWFEWCRAVDGF